MTKSTYLCIIRSQSDCFGNRLGLFTKPVVLCVDLTGMMRWFSELLLIKQPSQSCSFLPGCDLWTFLSKSFRLKKQRKTYCNGCKPFFIT